MLSVSDAAEILNISPARVRKLIADNILPASKIGRMWMLNEKDVMQRALENPKPGRPKEQHLDLSSSNTPPSSSTDTHSSYKQLYESCKEAFTYRPDPKLLQDSSPEEASFYIAVTDFFLQYKQKELIKAGVF